MSADYDMPSDLPRRRAAPLGWAFSLAFVIHGAMPGMALMGVSWGALEAPWKYPGIALAVVALGVGPGIIVSFALKARARIAAMREVDVHGVWAHAAVLQMTIGMGSSRGSEDGQRRHFEHLGGRAAAASGLLFSRLSVLRRS